MSPCRSCRIKSSAWHRPPEHARGRCACPLRRGRVLPGIPAVRTRALSVVSAARRQCRADGRVAGRHRPDTRPAGPADQCLFSRLCAGATADRHGARPLRSPRGATVAAGAGRPGRMAVQPGPQLCRADVGARLDGSGPGRLFHGRRESGLVRHRPIAPAVRARLSDRRGRPRCGHGHHARQAGAALHGLAWCVPGPGAGGAGHSLADPPAVAGHARACRGQEQGQRLERVPRSWFSPHHRADPAAAHGVLWRARLVDRPLAG
ncbi:hypothetical protein D3C72_914010 [compost metagenome]